jgi:hypothetical protein
MRAIQVKATKIEDDGPGFYGLYSGRKGGAPPARPYSRTMLQTLALKTGNLQAIGKRIVAPLSAEQQQLNTSSN